MALDEGKAPIPVYIQRQTGVVFTSTAVSTGTAGFVTGSTIDVRDFKNLTAYVNRGVSTAAVELEVSPDGSSWWQWKSIAANTAIPAAGEAYSLDTFVSGGTASFMRIITNVSGTASTPVTVLLNGSSK